MPSRQVFQHDCNFGYPAARYAGAKLKRVNGARAKNLATLKAACDRVTASGDAAAFLEFETTKGSITLDAAECARAGEQLLRICNMQLCCSADVLLAEQKMQKQQQEQQEREREAEEGAREGARERERLGESEKGEEKGE